MLCVLKRTVTMSQTYVRSHTAPDPDPMDEHNTACIQGSMGSSSGKVQPIKSATLFGHKMPEVAKTYKEDLTRRSLQNDAVAHLPAKRQKKKGVSKPAAVKW